MYYLTEDQAADEVSKWQIQYKDLKPALVTRQDLWNSYKSKNSEWAAQVCELGVSAATAALTGSGAFNVLDWVADVATEVAKTKAVEKACIAGAYLTEFQESKDSYQFKADKKFATKLASGFLTIFISAAGGALTAVTAGGAAIVTAIAIIVYIGDCEEAKARERWGECVDSMMEKYNSIREKNLQEINAKHCTELERLDKSNEQHDLEDKGLVKFYNWKSNGQINTARYETSKLKQLGKHMKKIDPDLGEKLWIIDLLEITRKYRDQTMALWGTPSRQIFDQAKTKDFMQSRIDCRAGPGKVPMRKAEQKLVELGEQALSALEETDVLENIVHDGTDIPKNILSYSSEVFKGSDLKKIQQPKAGI